MRILGIDPGSRTTGYAILQVNKNNVKYLDSGIIKLHQKDNFNERVIIVVDDIAELVEEYAPDEVSMESLIYVKSPTALIKLAQIRGAILAALCPEFEKRIFEYSPNLIKSCVSGYGHAEKNAVKKSLDFILGAQNYATHDASDAAAIALCHFLNRGTIGKLPKKSGGRGLSASLSHLAKGL